MTVSYAFLTTYVHVLPQHPAQTMRHKGNYSKNKPQNYVAEMYRLELLSW